MSGGQELIVVIILGVAIIDRAWAWLKWRCRREAIRMQPLSQRRRPWE